MIVVGNATTTRALQRATKTIPLVMASVNNAVGNGFVASLAKPGGNITGITTQSDETLGKLIGILHEVVPGARRVAIMLNEGNPNHAVFWAAAQRACSALDLVALRVVANTPAQFGAASEQIVRQGSEAVVVAADPIYLNERAKLQGLLQATRLPVAYAGANTWSRVDFSATQLTWLRLLAMWRHTWTKSSRAPSPPIFQLSNRGNSSW